MLYGSQHGQRQTSFLQVRPLDVFPAQFYQPSLRPRAKNGFSFSLCGVLLSWSPSPAPDRQRVIDR